ERERRLAEREELAEKPAGKRADVRAILGRERRQCARAGVELARSVSQIVEEGRDVRVVRIDLVPEAAKAALLGVARRECRLARAWRARDPAHGPARRAVQPREQPLAVHDRADHGSSRLGEGDAAGRMGLWHRGFLSAGHHLTAFRRSTPGPAIYK